MQILLTGASGYLGANLLRYFTAQRPDWNVHAAFFSIPPAPGMPNAHSLDVRDPASVERVLDAVQPDIIFHTAALTQSDNADDLYDTNARGTAFLAQGAARRGARLVHLSSDVIFDGQRGNYTEDDAPHPLTPYAVSKADAERAVLDSGANAVIVRTSLIYGFKPLDPRTRAVLRGEMPRLFTDEWRCPIWVENLAAALTELGEGDYGGLLHVAGTQPLNRYEFGLKLMEALGGSSEQLVGVPSGQSGTLRPLDCTLDVSRARNLLKTHLMSVDQVVSGYKKK